MSLRLELVEKEVEEEIKEVERAIKTVRDVSSLVDKIARKIVRKFLPRLFITTDLEYLQWAIENNFTFYDKLAQYKKWEQEGKLTGKKKKVWKTIKTMLRLFRKFKRVIEPFIADYLNTEFILESIKETRPDLAEVLETEKGKKWLEENIREMKELIGW